MANTGYKAYTNLKFVFLDNEEYIGPTKANNPSDPDYIAPFYDPYFCPIPSPPATPSKTPSKTPSLTPSISVSKTPQATPSVTPSLTPSISITPSLTPSISRTPSATPSVTPTPTPTPNTKYSVTIFASDESGIPVNGTKAQYSLNGSSGWTDFGPFSGYAGVCTFKGSAQFNPGDNVYIRIIGTSNQQYRHGVNAFVTCPLGTSGACVELISSINSNQIRAFFVSNLSNCP